MILECQQDDDVLDENIGFDTGAIEMKNNYTLVPTTTQINTQECRSDIETEPNTF